MSNELSQKYFDLRNYVGWTDDDHRRVAEAGDLVLAHAQPLVDDFYDTIKRHPQTARLITGGDEQIARLKATLRQWLRQLFTGPYDDDYVVLRSNIGRRHVAIGLDQVYANAALSRLRLGICQVLHDGWKGAAGELMPTLAAINKLLDLDLAIIEDAYQTEFLGQQDYLNRENLQLRVALDQRQPIDEMVGDSDPMKSVYRLIERTAPTDKPILIQGESGTGKELVAKALHRSSLRARKPLVVINCAALPESLLESELFGHEKGAFTGAITSKPGLFEVADGGTLFIDEIAELAGGLQAKMLRVLEDGSLRRVGSVKEHRVDARILAATNRDLGEEVTAGRFREDLYYRINVLTIQLPALRERPGDILQLAEHFSGDDWVLEDEFVDVLLRYSWPGNIRQLLNAIERAKILADDDLLLVKNLPPEIVRSSREVMAAPMNSQADLESVNRQHIGEIYRRLEGNKTRTARALGITRRTLYRLLEKYSIDDVGADA